MSTVTTTLRRFARVLDEHTLWAFNAQEELSPRLRQHLQTYGS